MELEMLSLHSEEDKTWRSWIRCRGKNLPMILKEFLKSNSQFKSEHKLTTKMLKDWKSGRSAIPLWVLNELIKINPELKEAIINDIESMKMFGSKEVRVPNQLTETIAEIVGRHCGDGSCTDSDSDFRISLKEHPSLITQHNIEIEKEFGIKPKNDKIVDNICDEAFFRSKIFARILTKIFQIPMGKDKTFKVKEPDIIKNSGLEFRRAFLRGLIDTDGSISHSRLSFAVVNENLAKSVFDILLELKFSPKMSKEKNRNVFYVRISGKENIRRFLEIVGSKNFRILSRSGAFNPGNR